MRPPPTAHLPRVSQPPWAQPPDCRSCYLTPLPAAAVDFAVGAGSIAHMPASPTLSRALQTTAPDGFASTEWSLVLAASNDGGPALDRLCRAYWRPVYVYIRATGLSQTEAQDAAQDFFADMLRRDWLKRADQDRGSFRGFLRSSVKLFLNNRRRHVHSQKRGGGEQVLPIEAEECEEELERVLLDEADPAALYEQTWASCVLETALSRLGDEQRKAGNSEHFEQLRPFLMAPPAPGDYDRIADRLKMSVNKVAVTVHRLSHRFGEVIRAEVASTLADRREVEPELRHLLRLVSRQS